MVDMVFILKDIVIVSMVFNVIKFINVTMVKMFYGYDQTIVRTGARCGCKQFLRLLWLWKNLWSLKNYKSWKVEQCKPEKFDGNEKMLKNELIERIVPIEHEIWSDKKGG
jgi:hypothetical protein